MITFDHNFSTTCSYALVTACNVLMNLVVLEPQLIQSKDSAADRTLKFIVKNLPNLTNAGQLPTYGVEKRNLAQGCVSSPITIITPDL